MFLCHAAGLLLLFQMPTLMKPVFMTASHNTIAALFTRYVATFVHLIKWYKFDLFDRDSQGCRSIKKVNLLHRKVYREINEPEDGVKSSRLFMTQYDMVITQWSSVAPIIMYPKEFGLHDITDLELQAMAHHWRLVGYILGIDERFNCVGFETLAQNQYFCQLVYDHEYRPILKRELPNLPNYGLKMSIGLARAINCMAPMLCLQGLLRYIYKTVLKLPNVYVEVKNRTGYRNLVYLVQVMMKYQFWHHVVSYLLRFTLFCVTCRESAIRMHYERKYSDLNYSDDLRSCPYSKNWC